MQKKTRKKQSRTNKAVLRHWRVVSAVLVVSLISLFGAYYLVRSYADPAAPNIVYFDTADGNRARAAGESFSLPVYSDVPSNQSVGSEDRYRMYQLTLTVSENVKMNGYLCGDAGPCTTYAGASPNLSTTVTTCIDINAQYFGKSHVRLVTLNMTSLQGGQYELEWSLTTEPHTCNGAQGGTYYHYAYGDTFGLGQGLGPNDGDSGSDGSGSGTGSKGTGGGSSTKSQSVKQSPEPNPVPTTSSQGDQSEQPKTEPSPFFDGKEYAPGSDESAQDLSVTASVLRQTSKHWPYLTGVAVMLAAGGYTFWHLKLRGRGAKKQK